MRGISTLLFVLLASLAACYRGQALVSDIRVTKTELITDHNLKDEPQVCWITATGKKGNSRIEYTAVNPNGNCPEIETVVVNHDGILIRKDNPSSSPEDSASWSAFVQSAKEIR